MSATPSVWFERPIMPEHRDGVTGRVRELGPASATPDDKLSALGLAEGAVASAFHYDGDLFSRAPRLLAIGRTGIGYDTVDVEAATLHGIAVCNVPSGPTISTAEHTLGLIIAAAKNVKQSERALRSGGTGFYERHRGIELAGKTLGLIGFGRIPRRVAVAAKALDMNVVAYDKYVADFEGIATRADSLEEVLAIADVVSAHVPATADTANMFNDHTFGLMKPGAVFVNTARGALVDLEALERALDRGHVFSAALDVTQPEPLPPDHPLLARDDIIITPHVAAGTPEAKRRNFIGALDQVIDVLSGRRPPHLVNPDVWPTTMGRLENRMKEL